jgi:hypothetical protein
MNVTRSRPAPPGHRDSAPAPFDAPLAVAAELALEDHAGSIERILPP